MARRSCLDGRAGPVFADTSVIINLHATGRAEAILRGLPNRIVVVEDVVRELEEGRRTGRTDAGALAGWIADGLVETARLGAAGMGHFGDLVIGRAAETLDDGEAATIAGALEREAVALIDDRKAIRICGDRFPHLPTACTVDVLAQRDVQAACGRDGLAEAIFGALYRGRMRVPEHYGPWVVEVIGRERAARCRSLPKRFRPGGAASG